jgi:hypothetical protein
MVQPLASVSPPLCANACDKDAALLLPCVGKQLECMRQKLLYNYVYITIYCIKHADRGGFGKSHHREFVNIITQFVVSRPNASPPPALTHLY